VVYINLLSQHLPEATEENHEKLHYDILPKTKQSQMKYVHLNKVNICHIS